MARTMLDEDEPMSIKEFTRSKYYHDGLWELFRGELIAMSPARAGHDAIVNRLSYFMQDALEKAGKACVVSGPNTAVLVEDDSFVMPDIIVSCDHTRVDKNGRYRICPELVVEVLSPATRNYCLGEKRQLYKDGGVSEYWIADIENKMIIVENFDLNKEMRYYSGDVAVSGIHDCFNFPVDDVMTDPFLFI
ncbi:MAG: Uma2 family endonuclease [Peptococcaceae bacterium]|jgi:Uma2 family endonuclease|nr:Uma2 family endonuclease [Peptococcaceae bacterium]